MKRRTEITKEDLEGFSPEVQAFVEREGRSWMNINLFLDIFNDVSKAYYKNSTQVKFNALRRSQPMRNASIAAAVLGAKYGKNETEKTKYYELLLDLINSTDEHADINAAIKTAVHANSDILRELILHPKTKFSVNSLNIISNETDLFKKEGKKERKQKIWDIVLSLIDLNGLNKIESIMRVIEKAIDAVNTDLLKKFLLHPKTNFYNNINKIIEDITLFMHKIEVNEKYDKEDSKKIWDVFLSLIKDKPDLLDYKSIEKILSHTRLSDPFECFNYLIDLPNHLLQKWPSVFGYGKGWKDADNLFNSLSKTIPSGYNLYFSPDSYKLYQENGGPTLHMLRTTSTPPEAYSVSRANNKEIKQIILNQDEIRATDWPNISSLMTSNMLFSHLSPNNVSLIGKYLSTHFRDCLTFLYDFRPSTDYLDNALITFNVPFPTAFISGWMQRAFSSNIFSEPSFDDLHALYKAMRREGKVNWLELTILTCKETSFDLIGNNNFPYEIWIRILSFAGALAPNTQLSMDVTGFITDYFRSNISKFLHSKDKAGESNELNRMTMQLTVNNGGIAL